MSEKRILNLYPLPADSLERIARIPNVHIDSRSVDYLSDLDDVESGNTMRSSATSPQRRSTVQRV